MIEKQQPYKYKVYEIIKKRILTGHYQAGEELNERELTEELGLSRTPIREAFHLLSHDGWVVQETYKGTVVRDFDANYLREVMRVRRALELAAVEDAVPNVTDEGFAQVKACFLRQEKILTCKNTLHFMQLDREFHQCICELCDNKTLNELLRNYNDIICVAAMRALASDARRATTIEEHRDILDALEQRDVEKAVCAMRRHMEQTEKNIQDYFARASG